MCRISVDCGSEYSVHHDQLFGQCYNALNNNNKLYIHKMQHQRVQFFNPFGLKMGVALTEMGMDFTDQI